MKDATKEGVIQEEKKEFLEVFIWRQRMGEGVNCDKAAAAAGYSPSQVGFYM